MPAMDRQPKPLSSYRKHWAARLTPAPFLPMSREEMDALGWDSCDIILVTGDAYVDHPSFGMAIVGRTLEAQGFRVGIISQPDWQDTRDFEVLGAPNLFFGITAGNMDSMVNRYTSDRKVRSDDAYTPGGEGGKRPDRSVLVYANRVREDLERTSERRVTRGALYRTLDRLEEKGLVRWELEPSQVPERGGHPMRRLQVTATGLAAARAQQAVLQRFFAGLDLEAIADASRGQR